MSYSSSNQAITLNHKPAVRTVLLQLQQTTAAAAAFSNCDLCFSWQCTSACRLCIEQIDDVVEEEEDEMTQAARLNSHAEASTSEGKVVLPSLTPNAVTVCHMPWCQSMCEMCEHR